MKSFCKLRFSVSYLSHLFHRITVFVDPELEINRYYRKAFKSKANLKEPKSLIEKIYWMQLHCDTASWTLCADKYRMRDYVKSCGLDEYLPKLYGKWNSTSEIDFSRLPKSFVLKSNNGCGEVLIVKDRDCIDFNFLKKQVDEWLVFPFGYSGFQPHYAKIKPCIIAEEFLKQNQELDDISPQSMVDFKFWCFNGRVESCLVTYGRTKDNLFIDLYDFEWNRLDKFLKNYSIERFNSQVSIQKPDCLEDMKRIASILSVGFPEMRVDLYLVSGKPIIGELTLSSGFGYFSYDYYNYLGGLCDISLMKRIK